MMRTVATIVGLLAVLGCAMGDYTQRHVLPRKSAPTFKATAVLGEDFVDVDLEEWRGKWKVRRTRVCV